MEPVLIIEDDQSIAELERDYLEANGFSTVLCRDGKQGLSLAQSAPFSLILLDVMLPGMDGFEVCRILRKTLDTPILLVSARREDIDKIRGLGLGADDYVVKPFSPGELVARVKAHIARYERLRGGPAGAGNRALRYGSLEIDLGARRVQIDGKEVVLTNKEFDLLAFLAQNPNIVFSKETLFDRIWGLDAAGDTPTVTVHIGRLREKLERDPSHPRYIETVWGAGYRFCRD